MSQNLDKMFKQIQKNSEELGVAAMRDAADKSYQLALNQARTCLQTYYKRKPKIYKRTNTLKNAILPDKPFETADGDHVIISFAIRYDASKLTGKYKSKSKLHQSGSEWVSRFDNPGEFQFDKDSNGIPDSKWILSNYLSGIHPGWYNGKDYGWKDGEQNSTKYIMTQFFEKELYEKAGELIYKSMQDAIVNFLNTNGGGK